jgi:hypothetical protein
MSVMHELWRGGEPGLGFGPSASIYYIVVCIVNVFEALEIDEPIKLVFGGKSRTGSSLVFSHSAHEIVRDADVQGLRTVRHDVHKVHRSFAW